MNSDIKVEGSGEMKRHISVMENYAKNRIENNKFIEDDVNMNGQNK